MTINRQEPTKIPKTPQQLLVLKRLFYIFTLISLLAITCITKSPLMGRVKLNSIRSEYTIDTPGCKIDKISIFEPSITKLIPFRKYIDCLVYQPLVKTNSTHLWIDYRLLKTSKVLKNITKNNIRCYSMAFVRPDYIYNISSNKVDDRIEYKKAKRIKGVVKVKDEFIKVHCLFQEEEIFKEFFVYPSNRQTAEKLKSKVGSMNVLLLGIDSVSRMNFYRTMPRTAALLNKLKSIEMKAYNKVGDNTFPNLSALLFGLSDRELKYKCLPSKKDVYDNCPFIWYKYHEAGYLTALAEDTSSLGTFNFGRSGFMMEPTDHYLHPFIREIERQFAHQRFSSFYCLGNKPAYEILTDYCKSFIEATNDSRYFGFFWETTATHDFIEFPRLIDDNYAELLHWLNNKGVLNSTIVIILSDHGLRWGKIRLTKQGRMEERLPFFNVLLPSEFKRRYTHAYKNLQRNTKRLTTPFDAHETLKDLINAERTLSNNVILKRMRTKRQNQRAYSLFIPIPLNRTCFSAGIIEHYCTCQKSIPVAVNNVVVLRSSIVIVKHINDLLVDHKQCARLEVDRIINAFKVDMSESALRGSYEKWSYHTLTLSVKPSNAIFEATVNMDTRNVTRFTVAGPVSRLNYYGDQSKCIDDPQLKLYCYCI